MFVTTACLHALQLSLFMLLEVFWPLALGFLLSRWSRQSFRRGPWRCARPPRLKALCVVCRTGCSQLLLLLRGRRGRAGSVRRGAHFVNAIYFEFASTNLSFRALFESLSDCSSSRPSSLGGLLIARWSCDHLRSTLRQRSSTQAKAPFRARNSRARDGRPGEPWHSYHRRAYSLCGSSRPSVHRDRPTTSTWTCTASTVTSGLGFLIAGALAALGPNSWGRLLLDEHIPTLNEFWAPSSDRSSPAELRLSVGNVPLAVVLWNEASARRVKLHIRRPAHPPDLDIYRKYYGAGCRSTSSSRSLGQGHRQLRDVRGGRATYPAARKYSDRCSRIGRMIRSANMKLIHSAEADASVPQHDRERTLPPSRRAQHGDDRSVRRGPRTR